MPDGWTAEFRIPFKTLCFDLGDSQTWGINFSRGVRRKNEVSYITGSPRRKRSSLRRRCRSWD